MFGYVFPDKPELKVREYELFRAYYCGVCKSIARRHGHIPRLTLNYDSAFLALLLSSVSGSKLNVKNERCIVRPVNKRYVIKDSDTVDYASDINIMLAYYSLKDNWRDEKSVVSAAGAAMLRRAVGRLKRKYSEKCAVIEERLMELSELEKQRCASVDRAAEPFARLMEEITSYSPACRSEEDSEILRRMGYNLGKWIYIIDAYDDIESDIKKNTYNPFLYQYGYQGEDIQVFKSRIRDRAEFNLTYTLSQMSEAYELLEAKGGSREMGGAQNKSPLPDIIENIIYMGMLKKTEQILGIRSCEKFEKSI
ncbi:hypothetical protein DFR58_103121 [Anaerobacterium chartisolvens]|uniref:Uncharacterized protein n=1 Tax=Anaerobacterium chartisolvens TaxID=1297424 RepID=A0A369BFN7_9FIRM|nr:DUF5685 family protein [Anaerobacterium chartisolvens]RCX19376.1 hypothetical protein DFR58_103121 [Anaerobacterium chartisolvens]